MRKMLIIGTDIISDRENKYNKNGNKQTDLQNLKEFCDNEIDFGTIQPIFFQVDGFNDGNKELENASFKKLGKLMIVDEKPDVVIVFSKSIAQELIFKDVEVIGGDGGYAWLERIKCFPDLGVKYFAASPILSFSYFTFSKDRIFNLKNTFQGIIKGRYNKEEHFTMLEANYNNGATPTGYEQNLFG